MTAQGQSNISCKSDRIEYRLGAYLEIFVMVYGNKLVTLKKFWSHFHNGLLQKIVVPSPSFHLIIRDQNGPDIFGSFSLVPKMETMLFVSSKLIVHRTFMKFDFGATSCLEECYQAFQVATEIMYFFLFGTFKKNFGLF